MGPFNRKNGMYSPKLGLYLYAVTTQMVIGYFLLLSSPNKLHIAALLKARTFDHLRDANLDMVQAGGILHILFAIMTFAFLTCTHFVTRCFKIPMMVLTALQAAYCSATASVCVLYLQRGYLSITKVIDLVKTTGFGSENPVFDNFLVENRNLLLAVGLLSVIATSFFHKAHIVRATDDTTRVMVVVPCISFGLGVAFCLSAPCRDYRTFTLGVFWMIVCTCGDAISSLGRYFCLKPIKLFMLAVYAAICILSLVTVAYCTTLYTKGNIDYSSYLDIVHGKVMKFGEQHKQLENYEMVRDYFKQVTTKYTDEQLNVYMGNGTFLLVTALLSLICLFFGIVALLYSLFRIFDHKDDDTKVENEIKVVVGP
ncbi:hypothetical protein BgAZ_110810 [Babesia gibsoni]|uniref:Uncharacterized protein n=1 Tax=Babesia gibsoni TaxID=33632 RepID=A0AAD8PH63_BABGI|nr:hypothetical protein BgAZ_110810 [Babesia gibsoni]